ncbi:unnamed protein product [Caenorhabditis nigoni]
MRICCEGYFMKSDSLGKAIKLAAIQQLLLLCARSRCDELYSDFNGGQHHKLHRRRIYRREKPTATRKQKLGQLAMVDSRETQVRRRAVKKNLKSLGKTDTENKKIWKQDIHAQSSQDLDLYQCQFSCCHQRYPFSQAYGFYCDESVQRNRRTIMKANCHRRVRISYDLFPNLDRKKEVLCAAGVLLLCNTAHRTKSLRGTLFKPFKSRQRLAVNDFSFSRVASRILISPVIFQTSKKMANQTLAFCPDHVVPVGIEDVVGTKTETITFGKILVNRVKVTGIVDGIQLQETGATFLISNLAKTQSIVVIKTYTEAFPRSRCAEFIIPDFVEVFGKIRIIRGNEYINAFHLNVLSKNGAEVNEITVRNSRAFYSQTKPAMPDNTPSVVATSLGLGRKVGDLSRFPIDMLERSPDWANNAECGLPSEIEELARTPNGQVDDSSDCSDEEDDCSDEEEDCSDEEESDSEEGGAVASDGRNHDENYEDEDEEELMEEEEKDETSYDQPPHFN